MMLNIKELTQHVTTADRKRFQRSSRRPRVAPQVVTVTVEGATVQVNAAVLSRIAKIAPAVEAEIIGAVPETNPYDDAQPAMLRLIDSTTTWTLYHQETK